MTLLGVAMDSGDHKTFNHLLDLGADPAWIGDMRDTDLHHAAKLADSAWLRALLLEAPAGFNPKDDICDLVWQQTH